MAQYHRLQHNTASAKGVEADVDQSRQCVVVDRILNPPLLSLLLSLSLSLCFCHHLLLYVEWSASYLSFLYLFLSLSLSLVHLSHFSPCLFVCLFVSHLLHFVEWSAKFSTIALFVCLFFSLSLSGSVAISRQFHLLYNNRSVVLNGSHTLWSKVRVNFSFDLCSMRMST